MTLSGMTGFARVEGALGSWTWAVEARSVNGRGLESRFRGPPGFEALERSAREATQARFQRGQVGVNIQARRAEVGGQARVNQSVLEAYLDFGAPLVSAGRVAPPTLDGLLALRGVIEAGEDDDPETHAAVEAGMTRSVALALDGLKSARLAEGAALAGLLAGFLDRIAGAVAAAEIEAAAQPAAIRDRFARRLVELVGEAASPERILQEAAVQALKTDVREELDRLAAHVDSARALLAAPDAAGRRLDFLTQEFMREANTLCAKSATTALTGHGLTLKAVIDQFREQAQNVE
jgi:uncharacterized protein (TIGR00255 family)